jgi:hypothetical protein
MRVCDTLYNKVPSITGGVGGNSHGKFVVEEEGSL